MNERLGSESNVMSMYKNERKETMCRLYEMKTASILLLLFNDGDERRICQGTQIVPVGDTVDTQALLSLLWWLKVCIAENCQRLKYRTIK